MARGPAAAAILEISNHEPDARNRSCLKPPVRCRAVRDGTPQRASGALGPHIVEVLLAIRDSAASGGRDRDLSYSAIETVCDPAVFHEPLLP